ncbi:hypothetical protein [Kitasatospora sp. NBC_00315]|uniref:hypothetical protein n=1 Tax=Kitasatospora sp. NBC_00315 TaxID=2975963 RepID=UPI003254FB21
MGATSSFALYREKSARARAAPAERVPAGEGGTPLFDLIEGVPREQVAGVILP